MMQRSSSEKWLVCRTCLRQPKDPMITIFDENNDKDLTNLILECGGVPIKKFDHFPDKICDVCLKNLRVAHRFRLTCQRSYKHLSRYIAPVEVDDSEVAAQSAALPLSSQDDAATGDIEDGSGTDEGVSTVLQDESSMGSAPADEQHFTYDTREDDAVLKLEPNDVKQEFLEPGEDEGDVVEVYEPMEDNAADIEAIEEFEALVNEDSNLSDEVEYLEDGAEFSSDEEFIVPVKTTGANKKLYRAIKIEDGEHIKQEPNEEQDVKKSILIATTSRATLLAARSQRIFVGEKSKRGRKPKNSVKVTSYICDVCGNIYPSQGRLTEHIKLHKGIKPHECEICGHAFAQTQQLARHMNTHTGNRPYKCQFCPSAFADLSTRNKHHRIHTNERPYVCDVCGKAFAYTNTLKYHKMIHTGEKPHVCDLCGKGFLQAYKLRNHKMTHARKSIKILNPDLEQLNDHEEFEVHNAAEQIMEI